MLFLHLFPSLLFDLLDLNFSEDVLSLLDPGNLVDQCPLDHTVYLRIVVGLPLVHEPPLLVILLYSDFDSCGQPNLVDSEDWRLLISVLHAREELLLLHLENALNVLLLPDVNDCVEDVWHLHHGKVILLVFLPGNILRSTRLVLHRALVDNSSVREP